MATITTTGSTAVAYEISGTGPAVVLVHGITESRRTWDPLIEPLAADHTVIALDLPGHGQSGPSAVYDVATFVGALTDVVAATEIDRPLLVGHSLGGVVATAAASALPCRGVVNVDQSLDLSAFQPIVAPLEQELRGDDTSFRAAIHELFNSLAGALGEDDRARLEALRRPNQDVVLAIWSPVLESSPAELDALAREIGSGVTVPYLSLHGTDPGDGYAGWLTRLIPSATVEMWSGAGHYPHLVDPERFMVRLRSFELSAG